MNDFTRNMFGSGFDYAMELALKVEVPLMGDPILFDEGDTEKRDKCSGFVTNRISQEHALSHRMISAIEEGTVQKYHISSILDAELFKMGFETGVTEYFNQLASPPAIERDPMEGFFAGMFGDAESHIIRDEQGNPIGMAIGVGGIPSEGVMSLIQSIMGGGTEPSDSPLL